MENHNDSYTKCHLKIAYNRSINEQDHESIQLIEKLGEQYERLTSHDEETFLKQTDFFDFQTHRPSPFSGL